MRILSYGEILWDIFGSEKEIGGAPFNFAAHMTKLGAECYIYSAVGNDELGRQALKKVKELGVNNKYISISEKSTGFCDISLIDNRPTYQLTNEVAYDYIPYMKTDGKFDALYFGSLVQRNEYSSYTLKQLINTVNTREVFFDINIRQNFYDKDILKNGLLNASILKMSRDEVHVLSKVGLLNENNIKKICVILSKLYSIKLILVTLDKDGAMLYDYNKGFIYSKKPKNEVLSAVGAGDSFSACFLYNYLNGKNLKDCIDRAVMLSDYVVKTLGAIPEYGLELLQKIT